MHQIKLRPGIMKEVTRWQRSLKNRALKSYEDTPGLRRLPLPAIAIIIVIAFGNVLAWIAVGITLVGIFRTSAFDALVCAALRPLYSGIIGKGESRKTSTPS